MTTGMTTSLPYAMATSPSLVVKSTTKIDNVKNRNSSRVVKTKTVRPTRTRSPGLQLIPRSPARRTQTPPQPTLCQPAPGRTRHRWNRHPTGDRPGTCGHPGQCTRSSCPGRVPPRSSRRLPRRRLRGSDGRTAAC